MTGAPARPILLRAAVSVVGLLAVSCSTAMPRRGLDELTGCWVSRDFDATSLLADATDAESAELVHEKMLLIFDRIDGTNELVFGRIYEWDDGGTYVLGPTYQNGAFNPEARFLTFGFPMGGLDRVTSSEPDELLYVHTKSSTKSAMSVRKLGRSTCREAAVLEAELLERQRRLR